MKRFLASVLVLALVSTAWAVEPKAVITGPTSVPYGLPFILSAEGSVCDPGYPISWSLKQGPKASLKVLDDGDKKGLYLLVRDVEPGSYLFRAKVKVKKTSTVDGKEVLDIDGDIEEFRVVVQPLIPVLPPIPPAPPAPVDPPIPATVGNLRVILLWESSTPSNAVSNSYYSATIRAYLKAKCLPDSTGNGAWRMWDRDTDISKESPEWQTAFSAAKANQTPLPKIVVFAGTQLVKAVPVPETEAATLELLQSFGGK